MVITFNHLHDLRAPRTPRVFKPIMSHQIYGEGEEIKGYIDPRVDVTLSPMFLPLLEVSYKSKLLSDEQATSLMEPMERAFRGDDGEGDNVVMTDRSAFEAAMEGEAGELGADADLGEVVLQRGLKDSTKDSVLTVYRSTLAEASGVVKKLHRRMEPLLLFFIDAASAIDAEDPCWEFLLCTVTEGDGGVRVVGLATVYAFYVYPDQRRFRLSQAFVMPGDQGKGIGSAIVDAVFEVAKERNVVDITLEDPTDDFRRLRDRKDLKEMVARDWVLAEARAAIGGVSKAMKTSAPDAAAALRPGKEFMKRLGGELMMNAKQAERMWESLLYKLAVEAALDESNADEGTLATVVEGWMSKNIEASFVGKDGETKAKEVAADKVIKDTFDGDERQFILYKDARKAKTACLNVQKLPANLESMMPVNDVTDESQQNAIAEYVTTRIGEVRTLVGCA